jgi:hypothetical protein
VFRKITKLTVFHDDAKLAVMLVAFPMAHDIRVPHRTQHARFCPCLVPLLPVHLGKVNFLDCDELFGGKLGKGLYDFIEVCEAATA